LVNWSLSGRGLTLEEVETVTEMARRLGELVLLRPSGRGLNEQRF
jgi:hypothetical protein